MYSHKLAEVVLVRQSKIRPKVNKDGEDLLREDLLQEDRRDHSTNEGHSDDRWLRVAGFLAFCTIQDKRQNWCIMFGWSRFPEPIFGLSYY
jgi:hypothetical protein